jgi:beta-glucanase (GH16 family)
MAGSKRLARFVGAASVASVFPLAAILGGCSADSSPAGEQDSGADSPGSVDAGTATPEASTSAPQDSGVADATDGGAGEDSGPSAMIPGWTLVWSDEFNGNDGTPVDPAKWQHDTGGNNANHELEYYSDSLDNSQQRGGSLVITATTDGNGGYTSARITTAGLFTQRYGRFEARAQLPRGQGMWPAFWMLGENIGDVGWPACGEIDIMETIGTDVGQNHGSLHSSGWDPSGVYPLPNGSQLSDAFHTYALEWEPAEIRFYVDDNLYETQDQSGAPGGAWAFDHPFFIIINLAVGGDWPGPPDNSTVFPQKLLVDWVRVYTKN